MPLFIYDCPNCDNREKRMSKDNVSCSKCNTVMEKNIVESSKTQIFDDVPGGYESTKKFEKRTSHAGQLQEAAFLAGETKSAY